MIAVTATSFIKSKLLCEELLRSFPDREVRFIQGADTLPTDQLETLLKGASGWLIGREHCSLKLLEFLVPELRVISKYGVGLDNIDLDACRALGIEVNFEPGVNRYAVAEHALGLMISLLRQIDRNSAFLHKGIWNKNGGVSLIGKKVGIVGLGKIGCALAEMLQPFGCELGYCDVADRSEAARQFNLNEFRFEDLLSWADVLTFHVPLTALTKHMLNYRTLELVKPGVYIINTSRGEVINQGDLRVALMSGQVAGAGLDVFEKEPLTDKTFYQMENLILTPHTAGNSLEAVSAMGMAAIRGLQMSLV